ncbi:MAG: hypothetical protein WD993_00475 [Thermoleophilaceae bacterium]
MTDSTPTGEAGRTTAEPEDGKARQAADQAREKAEQAGDRARGMAREQVDQRSTEMGQRVTSNAQDVRSVSEELRKQGKDGPARLADQAADRAERLGRWLEQSDGDRILHDVEDLGRRNPWALAAGGVALGFAASRLLKASSRERYQRSAADRSLDDMPGQGREPTPGLPTATMTGTAYAGTGARADRL